MYSMKCAGERGAPGQYHPAIHPAVKTTQRLFPSEVFRKNPCPGFFQFLVKVRFANSGDLPDSCLSNVFS